MRKRHQKFVYGRGDPCGRPGTGPLYGRGDHKGCPGSRHPGSYRFAVILALVLISGTAALFIRQGALNARSATQQSSSAQAREACERPGAYRYYTLKQQHGFVLARAAAGSSGQPLRMPQPVASFGNGFGQLESDAVFSMQLSPDGCYLAVDGTTDHGGQVWVFDTRRMSLAALPANVSGDFLNWLPPGANNSGHAFLYRPMMPLGPGAPRANGTWNPGLWMVDAATGQFRNINVHMPSAFLVSAAPSPDGLRVVYSTTYGLGMGSDVWMMNADGSHQVRLFHLPGGAQSIAALFAWSPDGSMIAYERLSDSPVPFQPAGLWVMNGSGALSHRLADTDGGHGFTLSWSADSRYIAYVARTNAGDRPADYNAQSLQSAVAIVDAIGGASRLVATPAQTGMQINDNPQWISNSATLSITFTAYNPFNLVLGGSPRYWSVRATNVSAMMARRVQPKVFPLSPAMSHVVAIGG